jgi:hypothetical protein
MSSKKSPSQKPISMVSYTDDPPLSSEQQIALRKIRKKKAELILREDREASKKAKQVRQLRGRRSNYENPFTGTTNLLKFNYTTCMMIVFAILFFAFILMQEKKA